MKSPLSLQGIIKALNETEKKLATASLSQEELQEFQTLAALLHERAIILNYKAKEDHVFGTSKQENILNEVNTEGCQLKEIQHEELNVSKPNEAPVEKPNISDGILFDFSTPETPKETSVETHEKRVEKDPLSQEGLFEKDISIDQPQNKVVIKPEIISEDFPKEENVSASRITEIKTDSAVYSFYERFSKVVDDSVMGVLGAQKIESIKGAFGLNDRLQFINELFAGNADAFNNSIEALDQQKSKEEAKIKLSEIAAQHQWEPDDVLVEDLAKLVQRRYAD